MSLFFEWSQKKPPNSPSSASSSLWIMEVMVHWQEPPPIPMILYSLRLSSENGDQIMSGGHVGSEFKTGMKRGESQPLQCFWTVAPLSHLSSSTISPQSSSPLQYSLTLHFHFYKSDRSLLSPFTDPLCFILLSSFIVIRSHAVSPWQECEICQGRAIRVTIDW